LNKPKNRIFEKETYKKLGGGWIQVQKWPQPEGEVFLSAQRKKDMS